MNRWLLEQPDRPLSKWPDAEFRLDPYEMMQCHPRRDVHMRSLALERADQLEKLRDRDPSRIYRAAAMVAGVEMPCQEVPSAQTRDPFQVWTHDWRQVLLQPEEGISLPGTLLTPHASTGKSAAILHFDDRGRDRLLYRQGLLARAARFLERDTSHYTLLSVDLRGWGDTVPAMYPYETASWSGTDRYLAYATAALGDSILAMRMRDGLAALAFLQAQPEIDANRIVVTGCGLAAIVALHVAAIGSVRGVVIWDGPASLRALLVEARYIWPADAFLPNVLLHYDLPELAAVLPCPASILRPLDGKGTPLNGQAVTGLNATVGRPICDKRGDDAIILDKILEICGQV
jgi:hypothetical protein